MRVKREGAVTSVGTWLAITSGLQRAPPRKDVSAAPSSDYFSIPRIAPPHAVQSSSFAAAATMGVQFANSSEQLGRPWISAGAV
jgi:hypothetical protein